VTFTTEHVVGASPSRNVVSSAATTEPVVASEPKDGVLPAQSDNDVVAGSTAERVVPKGTDDRRSVAATPRRTRDCRCRQSGNKNEQCCEQDPHGNSFPRISFGETRKSGKTGVAECGDVSGGAVERTRSDETSALYRVGQAPAAARGAQFPRVARLTEGAGHAEEKKQRVPSQASARESPLDRRPAPPGRSRTLPPTAGPAYW
jgi:hypothetical protein